MKRSAAAVLAAALLSVPLVLPGYKTSLATEMLIFAALAMSIDILAGYAGRTSLGHGALFGVAAYVVLYHVTVAGGDPWVAALLGIAAATVAATIFAVLAIRTSGVYFLLITLALGMIVWGICQRWTSVTGGATALMAFGMWRFVHSPFGLTLRGIRASESRMGSLGYDVSLHLFVGFVVSGFFAGAAGVLYAFFNSFASPATVALAQSVEGLLMVIVGGVGTLVGGLVGSVAIITLQNFVSYHTERWSLVLGLVFIVTMIFAPEGLVGRARILLARHAARVREP